MEQNPYQSPEVGDPPLFRPQRSWVEIGELTAKIVAVIILVLVMIAMLLPA